MNVITRRRYALVGFAVVGYVALAFVLHLQLYRLDATSGRHVDEPHERRRTETDRQSDPSTPSEPQHRLTIVGGLGGRSGSSVYGRRPTGNSSSSSDSVTVRRQTSVPVRLDNPVVGGCPVAGNSSKVDFQSLDVDFLYTGYFDDRLPVADFVRVIALLRRRPKHKRAPVFSFRFVVGDDDDGEDVDEEDDVVLPVELYEMCENHARRYGGWILSARLPTDFRSSAPPCDVRVSRSDLSDPDERPIEVRVPLFRTSSGERSAEASVDAGPADAARRSRPASVDEPSDRRHGLALDFAVCVPPLFGNLRAGTLIQFVELTRLLGAEHFIFYVERSASDAVRRVLRRYASDGLATAVDWRLPVDANAVWYNGQLLAINDCLYRSSHAARLVSFNDVDEFLVPHVGATTDWTQMMEYFWPEEATAVGRTDAASSGRRAAAWKRWPGDDDRDPESFVSKWLAALRWLMPMTTTVEAPTERSQVCGYTFQSAFFELYKVRRSESEPSYNVTSSRRSAFSRVRTKILVRPDAVFELGIHHVSRPLYSITAAVGLSGPTVVVPVPPEVAFVHHFRQCTTEYDYDMDCHEPNFVVDDRLTAAGYIPELRRRVGRVATSVGL